MSPRKALDELIKEYGETYASVSRLLGRNSAYIQQFVKRGSPKQLDETAIRLLSLHFDVPAKTFGGKDRPNNTVRSITTVPVLGLEGQKGVRERTRLMDEAWLRKLSRNPAGVAIVLIEGDAMHPYLQQGDEVLIQRQTSKENLCDGLYAIRGSAKTLVRRIAIEPTRNRISVLTDHPTFPDWNGLTRRGVEIVGRVIWVGLRPR